MKKLITTIGLMSLLLLFCSADLSAQRGSSSSDGYDKAVKIGPLGFVFGFYNATFEKKLKDKSSFVVGARYANFGLGDIDYTNFGLNAQYRIYFKEAIAGGYVAPGVNFGMNSATDVDNFSNIGIGANVGWQWITGSGFLVDLGIGARYRLGFGDSVANDFDGIRPSFQVQIGYAF